MPSISNYYTSPPAFGWEKYHCNAYHYYGCELIDQHKELNKWMGYGSSALVNEMAEYMGGDGLDWDLNWDKGKAWRASNTKKFKGYIPIFGSYIGLCHIVDAIRTKHLPHKFSHIVRGSVEALSLGFLLILPDYILTCYNNSKAKKARGW